MKRLNPALLICTLILCVCFPSLFRVGASSKPSQDFDTTPQAVTAIQLNPVLSGLSSPVFMANAHDGSNRLFIVEKPGTIRILPSGGSATLPTPFLNISSRVLSSGSEQGLLGLTFHPQYSTNRRFFVNYTRQTDGATVIAEYRTSVGDPNVADTTETVLLVIPQPFSNHNGGMVEFGPDGFLYIGMGDGGSANDPGSRAQNINEYLGKILRINVDVPNGSIPYSSPSTNPFFGATPGLDEIYAVGMRNPWRFSFDRSTGQLYCGDVGQGALEEIDLITLGGNYGWRVYEGNQCTNLDPSLCIPANFIMPIGQYGHTGGRCSITGGYAYRGTQATFPAGKYVFADYCTGEIFQLDGSTVTLVLDSPHNIAAFAEDEAGEIYVVGLGGTIHKIVNTTPTCTYSINPTNQSYTSSGGSGTVAVTTQTGCAWTAVSNDSWITVTSGASGTGSGSVAYSVAANAGTGSRTGTVTIGGQTFTINQSGITCTYSINPTSQQFTASGGSSSVAITTQTGCGWTATSNAAWISVTSGASGTGSGSTNYSVAANASTSPRSGTITIAGQTFTVIQDGAASCVYGISPSSQFFQSAGGTSSVSVTTGAGCAWTAVSNAAWISVTGGATGSGNGTVNFSVAINNTNAVRTGTMTIAGQTYTVTQSFIDITSVVTGLSSPVLATNARDGSNRLFIVEQAGRIKVLQPTATTPTVFLDISSLVLSGGQRGLLGLAFHPQFATNRRFYVSYTRQTDGATVIAEYQASASNPNIADPVEKNILTILQPATNNKGGTLAFGMDGFLYISVGDGGPGNDPSNNAQNINQLLGKILRINVDIPNGSIPYSSPSTNPFFGATPGADEIYAYGFRNPWRMSFDRTSGQLYVGDPGEQTREEIDIVTLGGNYGWRVYEGTQCTNLDPPLCSQSFIQPIIEYGYSSGRCAVIGGYAYRGLRSTLPAGAYIYGDFCTGEIFMYNNGSLALPTAAAPTVLLDTSLNISSFGEGEDGEIFVIGLNGTLWRISNPTSPACGYAISPSSQVFLIDGGLGNINVSAVFGCNWTAVSNASWITVFGGSSGSGNGAVAFSVTSNKRGTGPRVGTITVAGQTFTVNQAGPAGTCSYAISPSSNSFGANGGTGTVGLTTAAACPWTAVSNAAWISVTGGASGTGNGTVSYSVAANTGTSSRTGTITIGGQTFTVTQQGSTCSYSLATTSQQFGASGGTGGVGVNASTGCSWTAVSNAAWISVTGGASGTGNGNVTYSVAANASTSSRTGTITIAGLTFTVTQLGAAPTCTYSINPTNQQFTASGGTSSATVTTQAGCAWTAVSNAAWITVTSGASGTGSGSVAYSVAANASTSPRSGTITIAGQTFTINQDGAVSSCVGTLSTAGKSFTAAGGTGTVNVTASCTWTAVSNASWITVTSGASGTGNGVVAYSVAANTTGSGRTGTITIAGKIYTVKQQ